MTGPDDRWRLRGRTLAAMAQLCRARLLVAFIPFRRWRDSLGQGGGDGQPAPGDQAVREAVRLAQHVDRAAARLPFRTKCLPRAMALSWMLRQRGIAHAVVICARPLARRLPGADADGLHAWVECGGAIVLGDLPGPWIETWRGGG